MPFCPVYWTGQYCEYLGMETSNTRHSKRSIWELDSSLVAQTVKHLPTMWEIWVRSLGQEEPLEKEMATHSSVSCLGNHTDRGAWRSTVHTVAKELAMTYGLKQQQQSCVGIFMNLHNVIKLHL